MGVEVYQVSVPGEGGGEYAGNSHPNQGRVTQPPPTSPNDDPTKTGRGEVSADIHGPVPFVVAAIWMGWWGGADWNTCMSHPGLLPPSRCGPPFVELDQAPTCTSNLHKISNFFVFHFS